jgi:monoamine oxidase
MSLQRLAVLKVRISAAEYRVAEGAQALATALARECGSAVRLNWEIKCVDLNEKGVVIEGSYGQVDG